MRDAYDKLFKFINKEEFFKNSIEDIIYIDENKLYKLWFELKDNVLNNKPVYIRGYGRDAKKTEYFLQLYKIIFNNDKIKKDSSNNAQPTRLLKENTNYCKVSDDGKKGKEKIVNYQISHLFGKTKNPLFFNSPWNIAYIPKYLDPFTGHEAQGTHSQEFKELILPKLKEKFSSYIEDYNKIIDEFVTNKLEDAINETIKIVRLNEAESKRFKSDCKQELSKI